MSKAGTVSTTFHSDLIFDAKLHKYTLDGRIIPSVSEILRQSGAAANYVNCSDNLRQFGTDVHAMLHAIDKGEAVENSMALGPYSDGWFKFKRHFGVSEVTSEVVVYSRKMWYAGTADRIALVGKDETPAIIDIKTGGFCKSHLVQVMLYQIAAEEMGYYTGERWQRILVYLLPGGDYKVKVRGSSDYILDYTEAIMALYKAKERGGR